MSLKQDELIGRFGDYLRYEKRYSAHTIESYARDTRQLLQYLFLQYSILEPADTTHHQVRSWVVSLLKEKNKSTSVRRKVSSVNHFFRWMRKLELIVHNPVQKIQLPKIPERLPKSLPQNVIHQLWTSMAGSEVEGHYTSLRDRALIGLLYGCGLRRSELIRLTWKDYDLSRQSLKIFGKGRKFRQVPVGAPLKEILSGLKKAADEAFGENGLIEIILMENGKPCYPKFVHKRVVGLLGTVTTAEKRSPHTLRHSMATHLMDHGAELNAVKAILGHASLAATQVYTHNSISRLKEIYSQSHPDAKRHTK